MKLFKKKIFKKSVAQETVDKLLAKKNLTDAEKAQLDAATKIATEEKRSNGNIAVETLKTTGVVASVATTAWLAVKSFDAEINGKYFSTSLNKSFFGKFSHLK